MLASAYIGKRVSFCVLLLLVCSHGNFGYLEDFATGLAVRFHIVNAIFKPYFCFCGRFYSKRKANVLADLNGFRTQCKIAHSYGIGVIEPEKSQHITIAFFEECPATVF